jgi:hypothetical protein
MSTRERSRLEVPIAHEDNQADKKPHYLALNLYDDKVTAAETNSLNKHS